MKNLAVYRIALIFSLAGIIGTVFFNQTSMMSKTAAMSSAHDSISGEWQASLEAFGTITVVKMNLKVENNRVTGTVESAHTGAGTISKGSWQSDQLEFTADFAKHESVIFSAKLKNGKLTGTYKTEGRTSPWEATRKSESSAKSADPSKERSPSDTDPLLGEWEAVVTGQDTKAPVSLKLKLEGSKVTGTTDSSHLGQGTIVDGAWENNKLSFTINIPGASIMLKGELKDGKLVGEFRSGEMSGTWEAKKK